MNSHQRLALLLSLSIALIASAPRRAHAQAQLSFSGGNGQPFTLTLAAPVTYVITADYGFNGVYYAPAFAFQSVGNYFNLGGGYSSGTLAFTINNSTVYTINAVNSGYSNNDLSVNDFYVFGGLPGVSVGDIVTLTAGSLTTEDGIANGNLPADGTYASFVSDGYGRRLSPDGVSAAVPEPATWAMIGAGTLTLLGLQCGRRRRAEITSGGADRFV